MLSGLRIVFAGTPEFAAVSLDALLQSDHKVVGVYTQPDRPAGRGRKLHASAVKQLALEHDLRVYQPESLRTAEDQQVLKSLRPDILVVVAYGLILPQAVLDIPAYGCLNVHASLLPRWRGAAPIQRAIEAGDTTTGITIMQMDAGLDTGAMLATATCPIDPRATSAYLLDELALLGPPLLLEVLGSLKDRQGHSLPQNDEHANYAHKILKTEAQIDWSQPAIDLDRRVRAFNPFPICYGLLSGERVRVWQARSLPSVTPPETPGTILRADEEGIVVSCGEGALVIEVLQLEGGKALTASQLLSAHRPLFTTGIRFDLPPANAQL